MESLPGGESPLKARRAVALRLPESTVSPVATVNRGDGQRTAQPAAAPGACPFRTSDTPPREIVVQRHASRVRRMKRRVKTVARVIGESLRGGQRVRPLFVTLTYAKAGAWRPKHLTACIKAMREWARRQGYVFRYVWCAEIQTERFKETGAAVVHYHLITWVPARLSLPKPDKRRWWCHGSTQVKTARNAVGYLAKYASKGDDVGQFPKGLRVNGDGGIPAAGVAEVRWWMLPSWLRDRVTLEDGCKRAPSGGFVSKDGECFRSPWVLIGRSSDWQTLYFALREDDAVHGGAVVQ